MKNLNIEIKWAIIFSIISVLWILLERSSGLHDEHINKHYIYTNLVSIPYILVYIFALLDKRKRYYEGNMTYLKGFVTGLIITLFVTLLSPLVIYISVQFISPDYFTNMISYTVEQNIKTVQEAQDTFNTRSYIIQNFLFSPIMGIVTTSIAAIFTKTKR